MSPKIALFLCILFILYLFKLDFKTKPNVSIALWVPLIWLLIISSRMVSLWFYQNPEDYVDGNPIDPNIFTALIVIGLLILLGRKIAWSDVFKGNTWVFIYFAYCGISILWSDFPDVAFKRYIKAIGSLIMVLIVLTEPAPVEAIKTIIRRCAYMLIPLSIILYKYYPSFGRSYHRWSGQMMITGVTTNKNSLGILCLVCGIIFISDLFSAWRNKRVFDNKHNLIIFIMIMWLLIESNSATALLSFVIGISILIGLELPIFKRNLNHLGYYIFFIVCIFITFELVLNITQTFLFIMGRDATLTGRTDIWKLAIGLVTDPLIGTGFESFWLGNRMEYFADKYWFQMNEAHSGYVEIYLQGGLIGLFLLIVIIVSTYKYIYNTLVAHFEYGKLMMLFFALALIHNITESSFRPLQLMGFIFFLSVVKPPKPITVSGQGLEPNSMEKFY